MKKRTLSPLVYGLALVLVMTHCKDHDNITFPLTPNSELMKEINAIQMAPVTMVQPAAVTTTPGSVEVSGKATEVLGAMSTLSSGTVPASVQTAANELKAVLTPAEVNTLAAVTPATISDIAKGGAVPADLKAILDKVAANPALQAYLPKITLPTLNGKTVSGRSGTHEQNEKTTGMEVEDACVLAAQAAFVEVKIKLDAAKATMDAQVAASYSAAIAPLAGNQTTCNNDVTSKNATLRAGVAAQFSKAQADLAAGKDKISADLYTLLDALITIQELSVYSSINVLLAAELKTCSETTTAKTAAAAAARDANAAAVNASYQAAIAEATTKRTELAQSCHNQGGGK